MTGWQIAGLAALVLFTLGVAYGYWWGHDVGYIKGREDRRKYRWTR